MVLYGRKYQHFAILNNKKDSNTSLKTEKQNGYSVSINLKLENDVWRKPRILTFGVVVGINQNQNCLRVRSIIPNNCWKCSNL